MRHENPAQMRDLAHFAQLAASRLSFAKYGKEQVADLFSAADIIVTPSVRDDSGNVDGLPNVLLEGLASGTPVVATPAGGIGQEQRHHPGGEVVGAALVTPPYPAVLADPTAPEVLVDGGAGVAVEGDAALLEVDAPPAERLDRRHVVADEEDGAALLRRDLAHLAEALALERRVADGQHLVDDQDLGIHSRLRHHPRPTETAR